MEYSKSYFFLIRLLWYTIRTIIFSINSRRLKTNFVNFLLFLINFAFYSSVYAIDTTNGNYKEYSKESKWPPCIDNSYTNKVTIAEETRGPEESPRPEETTAPILTDRLTKAKKYDAPCGEEVMNAIFEGF